MKIFFKALIGVCPVPFMLSLSFATAAAAPSSFAPALLSGASRGRGSAKLLLSEADPSAGGQVQNKTEVTLSGLTTMATGYPEIGQNDPSGMACGDFDEFNNFNDPLSREGSKEFLRTGFLNDEAGKAAKAPALRDAPSDTGGKTAGKKQIIKKRKTVKSLRVDPLKSKNTI